MKLLWAGVILRVLDDRRPKRVLNHELVGAVEQGRGAKGKYSIEWSKVDTRVFDIKENWEVVAQD